MFCEFNRQSRKTLTGRTDSARTERTKRRHPLGFQIAAILEDSTDRRKKKSGVEYIDFE